MGRPLGWTIQSTIALIVEGHGRRLQVNVAGLPFDWVLVAIEHSTEATTPEAVLDAHSHAVLGTERSLADAIARADKYAADWQRAHAIPDPCPCGPIEGSS